MSARRLAAAVAALALGLATPVLRGAPTAEAASAPAAVEAGAVQVDAALAHYRELVVHGDFVAVAALFEDDATMAHEGQDPVVGRAAIARFLELFRSFEVQAYALDVERTTVEAGGDRALQVGRYAQTVRVPDGKVVQASGTFRAEWSRQPDGRWLLHAMRTASPG